MPQKIHPVLRGIVPIVKGIAKTFGRNCEVILYDFSNFQNSVLDVENGNITGKEKGSPIPEAILKALKANNTQSEVNFKSKSKDGKILKSSIIYIYDEEGKAIGCLCINIDISEYIMVKNTLQELCDINDSEQEIAVESYGGNVNDVLENIVNNTIENYGKPVNFMTKEEKVNMVKLLDAKGTFLIRGAIDYVAKMLCVSRYTIYNYLDEIRVGGSLE
ncbi:PAS domain-containing protein [Aceticella autotrophica]|uniref:PAS domain-containing protein n=1 Tax=Aceticella autotrophica TaxID=2755338 RepID=A0A975AUT0_9THEO|nr:PAS domain-containing protein [Aceticella autotrophica]QSZ26840.1 PAS domain-containing protein [Aceticella autotrophica]